MFQFYSMLQILLMPNTIPTSKIIQTVYSEQNARDPDMKNGFTMLPVTCANVEVAVWTFYSDTTKESYKSKHLLNMLMDLQVSKLQQKVGNYTT